LKGSVHGARRRFSRKRKAPKIGSGTKRLPLARSSRVSQPATTQRRSIIPTPETIVGATGPRQREELHDIHRCTLASLLGGPRNNLDWTPLKGRPSNQKQARHKKHIHHSNVHPSPFIRRKHHKVQPKPTT